MYLFFYMYPGSAMRPIATVSHIVWSVYPTSVTRINIVHADYCYACSVCWVRPLICLMFSI